jgi:DNA repair protein RadA
MVGEEPGPLMLELGTPASTPALPAARPVPRGPVPEPSSEPELEIDGHALIDDLEAAFGAMLDTTTGGGPAGGHAIELGPPPDVRELFAALAANHMRQVRDFMIGVKWGEPLPDWVNICGPAVSSLMRAAQEMDFQSLHKALADFAEALTIAGGEGGTTIEDAARERLLAAYGKLSSELPEAFETEAEQSRREAVIVHSLLLQIPEVRKLTVDKLYKAGLTSLDVIFLAKPDDIAATTGIGEGLAARIVERFQSYRREIMSAPPNPQRTAERERLTTLASQLKEVHAAYEEAAQGWSDESAQKKRKLRQSRGEVLLQVKVLLARLGEFEKLGQLEKLPFARKIESLEEYLREAKLQQAMSP